MLLTRWAFYPQARRFSFLSTSLACCSRLPHTRIVVYNNKRLHLLDGRRRLPTCTTPSRTFITGSCYHTEKFTSHGDQGDVLTNTSDNGSLPDNKDNELIPITRKLLTALAEYALDEDGYLGIEDLVSFLKQESALDICVIKATSDKRAYVEFLVVVSGVSTRHLRAMSKNLEQMFKGHEVRGIGRSGHVTVEGLESDHWMVVDIGNIVVHFFLSEVREVFELEKLWTLGPKYDDQFRTMLEEEEYLKATLMGPKRDSRNNSRTNTRASSRTNTRNNSRTSSRTNTRTESRTESPADSHIEANVSND